MLELDHKEDWALSNWCFWTVLLEKTLESPLDCKEIKPGNPKGDQSWIFIRWTDAEAPVLWPSDGKSRLIRRDPDAGKYWMQEEKGMTEDEMVGWHHRSMDMSLTTLWEIVKDREVWSAVVHGVTDSRTWPSNWTRVHSLFRFAYFYLSFYISFILDFICVPGPHPRCHTTFSCHVLLGCDSFWDFPCSWWFWQFWGVLVGYLIGCHCIRICLFFFSWLHCG